MGTDIPRLLEEQLETLRTGSTDASAETELFTQKCRAWLQSNRDGRGVTSAAIRDAHRGVVRFRRALSARHHSDSSTRRSATKAVTAARHESFPELLERLSALHGRLSKAGRRMAEKRRQEAERTFELDEELDLPGAALVEEPPTRWGRSTKLRARASIAREYLGDRDAEMWSLFSRAENHPLCLIKVDRSTGKIDECESIDGATPRLDRDLAFQILSALNVPPMRRRPSPQSAPSTCSLMANPLSSRSRSSNAFTGSGCCAVVRNS